MRKMIDSGVEWLGSIPETWNLVQLGSLFSEHKNKNTGMQSNNLLSLSYGNIIRKDINTSDGLLPESFEGYNVIDEGDIVLRLTDLQNDQRSLRVGLSHERGIVTSAYVTLRKRIPTMSSKFFYYLIHSYDVRKGFYGMGAGVRQGLNFAGVRKIMLILPPADEQNAIADFLEKKITQIDTLISNVQAQIEKLKAYKQSLITEVVTQGIELTVPMKDSGVEWIGKIPAHWEIAKLRTRTKMLTPMRDKPEDLSGPIPWVRIEDYCGKYITTSKEQLGVSAETIATMNLKIYPVGTVLCTSSCDLGKCAIVGRELVSNQRFIGIIPQPNLSSDYLYYLMLSNAERLNTLSTGSIQANLSRVSFEQLLVQFPPMAEQETLSNYLDRKCEAADRLIAIKQAKIEKLEQYKRSLIYEHVTGKKEVS